MKYLILFSIFIITACSTNQQRLSTITKDYEKTTTIGNYKVGVEDNSAILEREIPALEYYFHVSNENDFLEEKIRSAYIRLQECTKKQKASIPKPKILERSIGKDEIGFDNDKEVIIINRGHLSEVIKTERMIKRKLEGEYARYRSLEHDYSCDAFFDRKYSRKLVAIDLDDPAVEHDKNVRLTNEAIENGQKVD